MSNSDWTTLTLNKEFKYIDLVIRSCNDAKTTQPDKILIFKSIDIEEKISELKVNKDESYVYVFECTSNFNYVFEEFKKILEPIKEKKALQRLLKKNKTNYDEEEKKLLEKKEELLKVQIKSYPRINEKASKILYVGSCRKDLKTRLNNHIGKISKTNNSTYALRLSDWFPKKETYEVKIIVYKEIHHITLQLIEDNLATELDPACGKRGGNGR